MNVLTEYVAAQYGKKGVRCNVVAPGMVVTETGQTGQGHNFAMYESHHLTPRLGRPEDLAAMVTMLASDDGKSEGGKGRKLLERAVGRLAFPPSSHSSQNGGEGACRREEQPPVPARSALSPILLPRARQDASRAALSPAVSSCSTTACFR